MSTHPAAEVAMPECEKMVAVSDKSQVIGEFIEWAEGQGIHLAKYLTTIECGRCDGDGCSRCDDTGMVERNDPVLVTNNETINTILARFFEIDLDKVEAERRALLESLRSQS